MSKTAKKLLSVVLAVLVLAAGFSTTLGAFKPVSAEEVTVYDYGNELVDAFNSEKEFFLRPNKGSGVDTGKFAVAPASFGFSDYSHVYTLLKQMPNSGITGLAVSDDFFNKAGATYIDTETYDVEDYRAFITYEAKANTSFSLQYYKYNQNALANVQDSRTGEHVAYGDMEILVSNDGVNFIPAKTETVANGVVAENETYEAYTMNVASIGENRFVKVVYPQGIYDVLGTWVPQKAFVIHKVTLTSAEASAEKKVAFSNGSGTAQSKPTINGVEGELANVFLSMPGTTFESNGLRPSIQSYDNFKPDVGKKWGTYGESERDFFIRVQPGTRFYLSYNDHNNNSNFADGLVASGEIDSTFDFGFAVYTTDNLEGEWTKHELAPIANSKYSRRAMLFAYNFIIPENHIYAKIVSPMSGGLWSINGKTTDENCAGNDRMLLDHIVYTPLNAEYEVNSEYISVWDKNATDAIENTFKGCASTGVSGLNFGYVDANAINANTHFVVGTNERTDDQLLHATWKVAPGTLFNATLRLRYDGAKATHDSLSTQGEMHYQILTSPDNATWTLQATLGKTGDIYMTSTANYDVTVTVPKDAKYVKIVSYCRGFLPKYCLNDAFGVNGVSYNTSTNSGSEDEAEAVTYDYKNTEYTSIGTGASMDGALNYTASNFGEVTGSVAASKLWLDRWQGSKLGIFTDTNGMSNYPNLGSRSYIIYEAMPGTTFKATLKFIGANHAAVHNETAETFKFIISASDSLNGTYTEVASYYSDATSDNVINVPVDEKNFIKIEFPQRSMNTNGGCWGNHCACIRDVTFVPYEEKVQLGEVSYDYTDATTPTGTGKVTVNADSYEKFGIYKTVSNNISFANFEAASRPGIAAEVYGHCVSYNAAYGNVLKAGAEWGAFEAPYIVYKVNPGTVFTANIYLHTSVPGLSTYLNNMKNAAGAEAWGNLPTTFDFTIEASASEDGGWKNAVNTDTLTGTNAIKYKVPADCSYVKITYPQRGAIVTGTKTVNDVTKTIAVAGNDLARICGVTYVPFGTVVEDEDEDKGNDYTAKGDVVLGNDASKVAYEIYDLFNVEGTENGVVANEEGAYVTYKVSNETALVIGTEDNLKIAVSYDGKKFVKAELTNYDNAYTINLLDGKQYVRVYLGEGDAITSVAAKHLTPTVTFVNYAGSEEKFDVAYGSGATATLNTSRVGYTFTGWDKEATNVYVDTVVKAIYAKDTAKTYTVAIATGSEGEVTPPEGIAANALRFDDRVTVTAPASYTDDNTTVVFDKWVDAKGNTISNSHKFSFLVSGDITLEAVYAESKSDIAPFIYNGKAIITDNANGSWNMSVVWRVNAPANAKVTETGILFATVNYASTADWAANAVAIKHSTTAANKDLMYTVNNIKAAKDARYALPYAIVNGEYVFGNVAAAVEIEIEDEEDTNEFDGAVINYTTVLDYTTLEGNNFGPWNYATYLGAFDNGLGGSSTYQLNNWSVAGVYPQGDPLKVEWGTADCYLIYKVTPGTKFEASFKLPSAEERKGYGVPFEFVIASSASYESGWGKAVTTAGYDTTATITYDVPANCEYVKVTFPQKGLISTDFTANNLGVITGVKLNGEVAINYTATYNYAETPENNYGMWNNGTLGAHSLLFKDGEITVRKLAGNPGLSASKGALGDEEWDTTREHYLIYKVTPGKKFLATFKMADAATRADYASKTGEPFEFKVEFSAAADGGWGNALTTAGQGTNASIFTTVPAGCEYVKVTFPQKGIIPGTDTSAEEAAYFTGVKIDGTVQYNVQ